MRIKVVSVADDSFTGKDGARVTAAKLRYSENGVEKELSGYGPSITPALAWKAGEEQEIEPYTTKSGKPAFRLPGGGSRGGGGGGGFAAAYRNTAEGHASEQERMDRRTALMQAVAHGTGPIAAVATAGGGVRSDASMAALFAVADAMYEWLRKTANGKS